MRVQSLRLARLLPAVVAAAAAVLPAAPAHAAGYTCELQMWQAAASTGQGYAGYLAGWWAPAGANSVDLTCTVSVNGVTVDYANDTDATPGAATASITRLEALPIHDADVVEVCTSMSWATSSGGGTFGPVCASGSPSGGSLSITGLFNPAP